MLQITHVKDFDPNKVDYYQVLGVSKNASVKKIRRAYRALAKSLHPDAGGDAEQFRAVTEAYETLSDEEKRFAYDTLGLSRRELEEATDELIQMVVAAYSKGATNEAAVRKALAQMFVMVRQKLTETRGHLNGVSSHMTSLLYEMQETSYVMKVAIERVRLNLQEIACELETVQRREARADTVETLLKYLDLKTKAPAPVYQPYYSTSSNTNFYQASTFTVRVR